MKARSCSICASIGSRKTATGNAHCSTLHKEVNGGFVCQHWSPHQEYLNYIVRERTNQSHGKDQSQQVRL